MAEVVVERGSTTYNDVSVVMYRVLNIIFGLIEFMLFLRLVFELLGASPSSSFIAWLYSFTQPLVAPFTGAFPSFHFLYGTLDMAAILAMIVYAIIGWLLERLLDLIF